jgi:hypothetical protein
MLRGLFESIFHSFVFSLFPCVWIACSEPCQNYCMGGGCVCVCVCVCARARAYKRVCFIVVNFLPPNTLMCQLRQHYRPSVLDPVVW